MIIWFLIHNMNLRLTVLVYTAHGKPVSADGWTCAQFAFEIGTSSARYTAYALSSFPPDWPPVKSTRHSSPPLNRRAFSFSSCLWWFTTGMDNHRTGGKRPTIADHERPITIASFDKTPRPNHAREGLIICVNINFAPPSIGRDDDGCGVKFCHSFRELGGNFFHLTKAIDIDTVSLFCWKQQGRLLCNR